MQNTTIEQPVETAAEATAAHVLIHTDKNWIVHVSQNLDALRPYLQGVLDAFTHLNLGTYPDRTFNEALASPNAVIDTAVLALARKHQVGQDLPEPFRLTDNQLLQKLQVPDRTQFAAALDRLRRALSIPGQAQVLRLFRVQAGQLVVDQAEREKLESRAYTWAREGWEIDLWARCLHIASELGDFAQYRFSLDGVARTSEVTLLTSPVQLYRHLWPHGQEKAQRQAQRQELQTA